MPNEELNEQANTIVSYLQMRNNIKKANIAAFIEKNGNRSTWNKKQKKLSKKEK